MGNEKEFKLADNTFHQKVELSLFNVHGSVQLMLLDKEAKGSAVCFELSDKDRLDLAIAIINIK